MDSAVLVAFCGAAGAGKTTLVNSLGERFRDEGLKVKVISGVARRVFHTYFGRYKSLAEIRENENMYFFFQNKVACEQISQEKRTVRSGVDLVLSDRSILDNLVYTLIWCRKKTELTFFERYLETVFEWAYVRRPYDLMFYVPPFGEKVDDGFRTQDLEDQVTQDQLIQMLCSGLSVPVISTEPGERVDEVYTVIQEMIKERKTTRIEKGGIENEKGLIVNGLQDSAMFHCFGR